MKVYALPLQLKYNSIVRSIIWGRRVLIVDASILPNLIQQFMLLNGKKIRRDIWGLYWRRGSIHDMILVMFCLNFWLFGCLDIQKKIALLFLFPLHGWGTTEIIIFVQWIVLPCRGNKIFTLCSLHVGRIIECHVTSLFAFTETRNDNAIGREQTVKIKVHIVILLMDVFTAIIGVLKTFFKGLFIFISSITNLAEIRYSFIHCGWSFIGTNQVLDFHGSPSHSTVSVSTRQVCF